MPDEDSQLAAIHWEGDSREALAAFPDGVKAELGFALYQLQRSQKPLAAIRRMESLGPGVYELKEGDRRAW